MRLWSAKAIALACCTPTGAPSSSICAARPNLVGFCRRVVLVRNPAKLVRSPPAITLVEPPGD